MSIERYITADESDDLNNEAFFETIYKEHYPRLCNISLQIVADKDIAEDIVQELFVKLWAKRSEFRINTNIKGYLTKSVINSSLDYLEKNKKMTYSQDVDLSVVFDNEKADSKINFQELQKIVDTAIEKLPPKCRTIFVLCRFESMKYKEVAEYLDISPKTVENQMNIALNKLHKELKPNLKYDYINTFFWLSLLSQFMSK